jgi:hypothetical protein
VALRWFLRGSRQLFERLFVSTALWFSQLSHVAILAVYIAMCTSIFVHDSIVVGAEDANQSRHFVHGFPPEHRILDLWHELQAPRSLMWLPSSIVVLFSASGLFIVVRGVAKQWRLTTSFLSSRRVSTIYIPSIRRTQSKVSGL